MYDFFFFCKWEVIFLCHSLNNARIFISFLSFLAALTETHNFAIYIISCSNFAFCFFVISITFSSFFFFCFSECSAVYQNFQCETENSGNRLPSLERPHLFAQTEQKYTHWKKRRKPKQPNHERGFKKKEEEEEERKTDTWRSRRCRCWWTERWRKRNDVVKLTHSSPTKKKKQVYRKVRVPEMKRVRAGGGDGVK